jgi:predicted HicB family RNase H-like nuclease
MGRQATNSGRISLDVDPALKLKASIAALKSGVSLTRLVERGLVLALAELRAQAKEDEDK